MEANLEKVLQLKIARTVEALRKNKIQAVYVPTKKEALAFLESVLNEGEAIAVGGSVTLSQIGAMDLIKDSKYHFLDRNEKHLPVETYLCSSNAITENGLLYNVDGSGKRVASIISGPERVIIFAGYNKIVTNLDEAVKRVKNIAAPADAIRLGKDTYCAKHGHCICPDCDAKDFMFNSASMCENSICRTAVVTGPQKNIDRITVVIIGEELGY